MFELLLTEKSIVEIKQGQWNIQTQQSESNQHGELGKNDYIRRQDAVQLLGEMNMKLVQVYKEAKKANPQLAEELLQSTEVLSYAMWGLRELNPASETDKNKTAIAKMR